METKLWALVALILSCQLAPIIHASRPVLAKSQHTVAKSESITTIAPTTKQVQHKNTGLRKLFAENASKKLDTHKSGSATDALEVPNELKPDTASFFPWHAFTNPMQSQLQMPLSFPMHSLASMFDGSPFSPLAKFMPFFGYTSPVFIPYPVMMPSDMFYPTTEDTMSRTSGTGRRPVHDSSNNDFLRNSPIYYVRLPPAPYMFMPSFNYAPSPFLPYSPLSAFQALPMSSVFNLPMNFLANGKPNGIYRIDGASNELSNNHLSFTGARPTPFTNPFRPVPFNLTPSSPSTHTSSSSFSLNQPNSQYSFPSPAPASTSSQQDSKLNTFKRPFVFNGRPEDIYILPNNFNPSVYSENAYF